MDRPLSLVVDRDPTVRSALRELLEASGLLTLGAETGAEAVSMLSSRAVDLIFVDVKATDVTASDVVGHTRRLHPEPLLVALGLDGDIEEPAAPFIDALPKPIEAARLHRVVGRATRHVALVRDLRRMHSELKRHAGYDGIVGRTEPMQRLREGLRRIAAGDRPLLLVGEEGSGKELVARTLHDSTGDPSRPFILVSCAELREGDAPAAATGGTVYFDELADLPLDVQRRLLAQIGAGDGTRYVAGTRLDPMRTIEEGRLLEPLRRKLGEETLRIPPLRERVDDIVLLADHFIGSIREINRLQPMRLSAQSIAQLRRYAWPGNVQELRYAIEHAVILSVEGTIRPDDLPDRIRESTSPFDSPAVWPVTERNFRQAKREVVERFERAYLGDLLEHHGGNVTAAAQQAGMLRSALQRLLRKYRFKSAEFRHRRRAARPASVARGSVRPR